MLEQEKKRRKVLVATPCYDGRMDVWYANSLMQCIKLSPSYNIEIIPIWLSYDALVQRARNDLVEIAIETDCDDIFFIDNDIEWEPQWFFKLLEYQVDVVGGTYRKKTDQVELYVVRVDAGELSINKDQDLVEVDGLGAGFLRMSRKAIDYLWENSEPYIEIQSNKKGRMVFDVKIQDGFLISEEISMLNKLKQGNFKIFLDPSVTCTHIGPKKFKGNFLNWLEDRNQKRSIEESKPLPESSVRKLYE
jgi:glycosyltransferase involved in cell wall biosynthesis